MKKFGNEPAKKQPEPAKAAAEASAPTTPLDKIDVGKEESGYDPEAPSATLCWQRPSMTADDPMAPPCDRKQGHHGLHTWEYVGAMKQLSAELKNEAGAEAAGQVRRTEKDILLDVAGKLDGILSRLAQEKAS